MRFYLKPIANSVLMLALISSVQATELVHRFENPSFGGNPNNGTFLLNQADQQNKFKDPSAKSQQQKSELEKFKDKLQQSILNKIAQNTTADLFDDNGNIVLGSDLSFDLDGDGTSNFSIAVDAVPGADGNVSINISDGISETILTIPAATL
ncbi:MAG: curli assembly protein CsgF [Porticoccaceae bacterium]